jgi:TolB-like protein
VLRRYLPYFLMLLAALLAGCATIDHSPRPALEHGAKWAIAPFLNHTDAPQAGMRAEAMADTLLRALGIGDLVRYPAELAQDSVFEPSERKAQDEALRWAKEQGVRYALTGAVTEWRYKAGVDGEPAVGLSLSIVDLQSGSVVWSAAGAKSGWSRDAVSAVAQNLMHDLLQSAGIR